MAAKKELSQPKLPLRLDFGTVLGFIVALSGMIGGLLLEGGKLADITQITAAMIVLGGTFGAVLISTPLSLFLGSLKQLRGILLTGTLPVQETLTSLLKYGERARRNGLSSLELDAMEAKDPFMNKALNLAADGTECREIDKALRLDIEAEEERAASYARVWENAAGFSPTIGIIGAVLGLIQVMKHLENLDEVGRGIAVAFVATVYGVASANLLFLPAAAKLKARAREAARLREMILEGMLSIAEGMNPRLIEIKLEAFLSRPRKLASLDRRSTFSAQETETKAA